MPFITQGKTNWKFLLIIIILAVIVGGLAIFWQYYWMPVEQSNTPKILSEKYCKEDGDCVCGIHKTTRSCFYGNKDYVDTTQQCPDFCTGIGGNFQIKCVNKECKQISTIQDETADWKTYRNIEYGFEFKYPDYWAVKESLIFDSNSNDKLNVRHISEEQKSALFPSYCQVHLDDSRCQSVKLYGNYIANIDWQWSNENTAYISIYSPDDGWVEIYVTNFITADKEIILQILSTFKFIEEGNTKEQSCVNSGGTVTTSLCCKSGGDFPNSCMIGGCGCSLDNSHEVKTCYCGLDKCFNGTECISQGVTITTHKTEYGQGEIVKIIVKNDLDYMIGLIAVFTEIEKLDDGIWANIWSWSSSGYRCSCDPTCYFGVIPEIEPNVEMPLEWNQKMWTYCDPHATFGDLKDSTFVLATSGKYRIAAKIRTIDNKIYIINSNEFTIK